MICPALTGPQQPRLRYLPRGRLLLSVLHWPAVALGWPLRVPRVARGRSGEAVKAARLVDAGRLQHGFILLLQQPAHRPGETRPRVATSTGLVPSGNESLGSRACPLPQRPGPLHQRARPDRPAFPPALYLLFLFDSSQVHGDTCSWHSIMLFYVSRC